ncbi:LLM class F420-dependent oxidoreductase [Flindersiella endophytica]
MRLRVHTEPQQGASYASLLRVARTAETCGFDGFFRSDHYLAMGDASDSSDVRGYPGPTDAWTTIAGLAVQTSRIRLGTLISPATFRLPGPLAIQIAQIDQMSGGRVELGLGTGWFAEEHTAYGIPFPAKRFALLEEQLAIITGLWMTPVGERYSFKGEHYQLEDSPALPKPVQTPRPPIIIGGGGRARTPSLAARYATEFNLGFDGPRRLAPGYERVRAACEAADRDPSTLELSAVLTVCCGKDELEARRRAAGLGLDVAALKESGLVGTPAAIVDRIGQYAEIGVGTIYFQLLDLDDLDQLELLASDVAPQLT